jgi:glycosyltransferase involved in cell wall biosynthesis
MRILHITPAYHPAIRWGGPIRSVRLLAQEQAKLGHQVSVFTTAFGLDKNETRTVELDGVMVHYFTFVTMKRWFISFALVRALWRERRHFDAFHIHLVWDPVSWMSGALLALLGTPFVISPRGTVERQLVERRSSLIKKTLYAVLLRWVFKRAKAFHFTSQDERKKFEDFVGFTPGNVIAVNPFKAAEVREYASAEKLKQFGIPLKKYLYYEGRINWKKRLGILMRAFAEFSKRHEEFRLVIAGPDEENYFTKLRELAVSLEVIKKVFFINDVIEGELWRALFQNAFVFVLPSFSENFGFVAVESLAAGVPVIVSDGVAIRDIIIKYGAGVEFAGSECADEPASRNLAACMEALMDQNRYRSCVQGAAQLVAHEFDNRRITEQVTQLYG